MNLGIQYFLDLFPLTSKLTLKWGTYTPNKYKILQTIVKDNFSQKSQIDFHTHFNHCSQLIKMGAIV